MARRYKGIEKQLRNYINEDIEVQEMCRDYVFNIYLADNDENYFDTIDTITADLVILERLEQYERCCLLNDILKEFA